MARRGACLLFGVLVFLGCAKKAPEPPPPASFETRAEAARVGNALRPLRASLDCYLSQHKGAAPAPYPDAPSLDVDTLLSTKPELSDASLYADLGVAAPPAGPHADTVFTAALSGALHLAVTPRYLRERGLVPAGEESRPAIIDRQLHQALMSLPATAPATPEAQQQLFVTVYSFQFYQELCRATDHAGPLYTCSFLASPTAAQVFPAFVAQGLAEAADPGAMLDYFGPLQAWLAAQSQCATTPPVT